MTDLEGMLSDTVQSKTVEEPETELNLTTDHQVEEKPFEETSGIEDVLPGNRQHKSETRRGRAAKSQPALNPHMLSSHAEKTIQEMEAAYLSDLENNQIGKPALHKLQMIDKVVSKLRNPVFAEVFLEKNGLEQFHNFLKRLPDGSWPLSNLRSKVLQTLIALPYNEHHLKYTKLGKTLTSLQRSRSEYGSNKKMIQVIKDKWSRIVCGINMSYQQLEHCEKENHGLMKKKRKRTSSKNFGKPAPGEKNPASVKKLKMGFNFTIRPRDGTLGKRGSDYSRTQDIDKYLTKIRKATKFL